MAEDKSFEPTQSRIEKAKREGDIARSQELGAVAAFAAGLLACGAVSVPIGACTRVMLEGAARGSTNVPAFATALALMLVPAACAAIVACAVNIAQSGGMRFIAVSFKPERLNPSENLKRMFSRESAITAARATAAFACAGGGIVPAFCSIYAAAMHAGALTGVAAAAWSGAFHTAAVACTVGAVFAAADYGVQFVRWRKRMRMSHEDLKRDQKEHDGDPHARGRRRALHRQISRGSLRKVQDAAFVVTNPTHIAIAIEYRPPEVAVPRVLVRAADEMAARVRELAGEYSVPLFENVPLARRLYATTQPGQFIPQETYVAVAEIVAALARTGAITS